MSHQSPPLSELQRIEELVQQIEQSADPALRSAAVQLVQLLMDLHGSGLSRMLEIVAASGEQAAPLLDRWAEDELVAQILMLYDLHPQELHVRVQQALERVRPQLEAQGAKLMLLGCDNQVVRLKLSGGGGGCGSSVQRMQLAVEEALHASASDLEAIQWESSAPQPEAFVPLEMIKVR